MSMRTVNFISGGGSTNLAVLKAQRPGGVLHGLVKTVAIISDNSTAGGITKAQTAGFKAADIHVVSKKLGNLGMQILKVLDCYRPDWFHQLGWLPLTPNTVLASYRGLNQHLGPGGQYMIGATRVYTHMRFCEIIKEIRPIPVFCQYVAPNFDDGDAILVNNVDISLGETVADVAEKLLPIEHETQIQALKLLATGLAKPMPVPRVYRTSEEKKIMDELRIAAHVCFVNNERWALEHKFMMS